MLNFIKEKLQKIYTHVTSKLGVLFGSKKIDQATLHELEKLLLAADTGVKTTRTIIAKLTEQYKAGSIAQGADLKAALEVELNTTLQKAKKTQDAEVYLLVGINGSGKTTFAAKLANKLKCENKKVLFVAGDTFRAAATNQLNEWAQKIGVDIVIGQNNQDPASVIFKGCEQFIAGKYDTLIIDTAGRLQTKVNLMKELEKIKTVVSKKLPEQTITTLLTIDSMLGQNSFEQAQLFHESTQLNGIILTKMDGTGKGGIVFAIVDQLGIPVQYVTFGEQLEHLKEFNASQYVTELLN